MISKTSDNPLPKITIVTPSYNQGSFLEECIVSVLDQNYPNLEYMVIDGGSTDNSVDIIRKYENRISYWESVKDRGQSHALNKGFQKSTGEIISWLCSDDLYLPGTLFKVAETFIQNPEAAFIHGKTILFGDGRKDIIKGANPQELPLKYFSIIPFPQPSSFFRKKILIEQGYLDESFHYGMDYDLVVRTALNYQLLNTDFIFSKYRLHNESKTVKVLPDFAKDWSLVFLKFLRSVDGGEQYIQKLKSLDIFSTDTSKYSHAKKFNESELKTIFCYFLMNQLIVFYELLEKERCLHFLEMIRKVDALFYASNNLSKVKFRIQYIPSGLVRWVRSFKRSA